MNLSIRSVWNRCSWKYLFQLRVSYLFLEEDKMKRTVSNVYHIRSHLGSTAALHSFVYKSKTIVPYNKSSGVDNSQAAESEILSTSGMHNHRSVI